jgi:putative SOS response-associated peptidase YedK
MGNLSPRYNVAPSQAVLVARNSEWGDYRELATLYWGLVAPWAKDFQGARKMINARAETAHERPMFRNARARRRCLVDLPG